MTPPNRYLTSPALRILHEYIRRDVELTMRQIQEKIRSKNAEKKA